MTNSLMRVDVSSVVILGQLYKQGGVTTCIEEITRVFEINKNRVITLVTFTSPSKLSSELCELIDKNNNVKIIHLPSDVTSLISIVRNSAGTIVISNTYYSIFLLLFKSSRKFHILHGWGMLVNGLPRFVSGNLGNMVGSWFSNKTIANSYHTALVGRVFGIEASTIIPLGIPNSRLNALKVSQCPNVSRDIDLLYVGRFIKVKKIDVMLESFKSLSKLTPGISLHVVGGKLSDLDFEIDESLASKIHFHGFVDNIELSNLYRRSKIFISLHPDEPFGLTFVEALAHGTPIIASKGSGIAPFVNAEMGSLVDINEHSVCQAVTNAFSKKWDYEYIEDMALQTFSWEKIKDYIEAS